MNAPDLIASFAQRIGLPELQLGSEDTARIVIDGGTAIDIEHDAPGRRLFVHTSLGEPPAEGREACYARLLGANLFMLGSGGGAIGLDSTCNELVLSRVIDLDFADPASFEAALDELACAAEGLRAQVGLATPTTASAGVADVGQNFLRV